MYRKEFDSSRSNLWVEASAAEGNGRRLMFTGLENHSESSEIFSMAL
jgi:hypothetical protein